MTDRDVRAENLRLNAELHECYIEIDRLRLALAMTYGTEADNATRPTDGDSATYPTTTGPT
jgi:hypothetical protein